MTDLEFEKFKKLIYDEFGNYLNDEKKITLDIKINKIIRKFNPEIKSIKEYYEKLMAAGKNSVMWQHFVDYITVHKTSFFRESEHFDYISSNINKIIESIPNIRRNRELRVWCAASSSGEEPYSILMTLKECMPSGYDIKFLASDISELVLGKAINGIYPARNVEADLTKEQISKYFVNHGDTYEVKQEYRAQITFRKVNLTEKFKFKNKFDIIFCRNVMIYFDNETKSEILNQMYDVLSENGILILGLSESMGMDKNNFSLMKSSMYKKS